jgi:osmotically-inducible protein OsmY
MEEDLKIKQEVLNQLSLAETLKPFEIEVFVNNGVITLKGTVDTYRKKLTAERVANEVDGVKAVIQELQVHPSSAGEQNDSDIAEIALAELKRHAYLQNNNLTVWVKDGWVTLEGDVEWEHQKYDASSCIEDIVGIKGVANNINVKRIANPDEVARKTEILKSAVEQFIKKKPEV